MSSSRLETDAGRIASDQSTIGRKSYGHSGESPFALS